MKFFAGVTVLLLFAQATFAQSMVSVASGGSSALKPTLSKPADNASVTYGDILAPDGSGLAPASAAPAPIPLPVTVQPPTAPVAAPVVLTPVATPPAAAAPAATGGGTLSCTAECNYSNVRKFTCSASGDAAQCLSANNNTAVCTNGSRTTTCNCSDANSGCVTK